MMFLRKSEISAAVSLDWNVPLLYCHYPAPDVTRHWSPETEHRDSVTRLVTSVTPGPGFHLSQERAESVVI